MNYQKKIMTIDEQIQVKFDVDLPNKIRNKLKKLGEINVNKEM